MKKGVEEKYEAFYSWLRENHRSDEAFLRNDYGIKRLKGMVSFMNSEDWSRRLPEFQEYIRLMDGIRGTSFLETFPEMAGLIEEEYPRRAKTENNRRP
jgi:hypothetical protein